MPESNTSPSSAFIWYHADMKMQESVLAWQQTEVAEKLAVSGRLLIREQAGKTTFMEIYEHVEWPLVERIEQMANQASCFAGIERRCEFFTEVSPYE